MNINFLFALLVFALPAYAADTNRQNSNWLSTVTRARILYACAAATTIACSITQAMATDPQCTGFDFACNPEGQCLPGGNMITNGTDTIIFPYEE